MYSSARSMPSRRVGSRSLSGIRHAAFDRRHHSGDVPQVTCGAIVAASIGDDAVELRARVGLERAPVRDGAFPHLAGRSRTETAQIRDRLVVDGRSIPARAPASIDMLHTVMRPSIDRRSMAGPPNSIA
jgi:hypothetical protein